MRCRLQNWAKHKLRSFLGLKALDEQVVSLVKSNKEHQQLLELFSEWLMHPRAFKPDNKGLVWKSPKWETSKKVWFVTSNKHSGDSDYKFLERWSLNKGREQDYEA